MTEKRFTFDIDNENGYDEEPYFCNGIDSFYVNNADEMELFIKEINELAEEKEYYQIKSGKCEEELLQLRRDNEQLKEENYELKQGIIDYSQYLTDKSTKLEEENKELKKQREELNSQLNRLSDELFCEDCHTCRHSESIDITVKCGNGEGVTTYHSGCNFYEIDERFIV